MQFSLIVATLERVSEFEALLESLSLQTFKNFEVIVVDQNKDDRLASSIDRYSQRLRISRVPSTIRNNSHARNIGIRIAVGDIVSFPDDDCLYPPDILERVDRAFKENPGLAVLSGPAVSPTGRLGTGRWHRESGLATVETIWTSIVEFNMFIDSRWAARVGCFDEAFGIGGRFGSAEGVDLALSILRAGGTVYYDFDLRIIHPDKTLTRVALTRAYRYGTGLGHVMRKHKIGAGIVLKFLVRPLGGILLSLLRLNKLAAAYYWQTFRGRLSGYCTTPENMAGRLQLTPQ